MALLDPGQDHMRETSNSPIIKRARIVISAGLLPALLVAAALAFAGGSAASAVTPARSGSTCGYGPCGTSQSSDGGDGATTTTVPVVTQAASTGGHLAFTGFDAAAVAGGGAILLLAGGSIVLLTHRRRRTADQS